MTTDGEHAVAGQPQDVDEDARGPAAGSGKPGQSTQANPLRGSRTSRAWIAVAAMGILLLLLVVFVAQNTVRVQVRFLGWSGHPPLAVAILIGAAVGLALALSAGTLRIWQIHRRVRRSGRSAGPRGAP